jgi:hypothetical protein
LSEFVERLSRALCQNAGYDPDGTQGAHLVEETNWTFFTQMACAALEAMREPTQAMIEAARDEILVANASGVWRTMINAALSSGCAETSNQ